MGIFTMEIPALFFKRRQKKTSLVLYDGGLAIILTALILFKDLDSMGWAWLNPSLNGPCNPILILFFPPMFLSGVAAVARAGYMLSKKSIQPGRSVVVVTAAAVMCCLHLWFSSLYNLDLVWTLSCYTPFLSIRPRGKNCLAWYFIREYSGRVKQLSQKETFTTYLISCIVITLILASLENFAPVCQ